MSNVENLYSALCSMLPAPTKVDHSDSVYRSFEDLQKDKKTSLQSDKNLLT